MKKLKAPPANSFKRLGSAQQRSTLRALVERWANDETITITGMWPLLAAIIASDWASDDLRQQVRSVFASRAAFLGADAPGVFEALKRATPRWKIAVLAAVARARHADHDVRIAALSGLRSARETRGLVKLATALQHQAAVAGEASALLEAFEQRRSSSIDELVAAKKSSVLKDHGQPVTITQVATLGTVDFEGTALECWDPVQQGSIFTFTVPSPRAKVSVCFEGTWARLVTFRFARGAVTRWKAGPSGSGRFGTLVVTRRGPRALIERRQFDNWWDEFFDAEFDSSDGAKLGTFELEAGRVPFVAWNDQQLGGTLYRGQDAAGQTVALLFDGLRVRPDEPTA